MRDILDALESVQTNKPTDMAKELNKKPAVQNALRVESDDTNEGNEFSGALAKAKKDGKAEFTVDGKKYKVEAIDSDEDTIQEAGSDEISRDEVHNYAAKVLPAIADKIMSGKYSEDQVISLLLKKGMLDSKEFDFSGALVPTTKEASEEVSEEDAYDSGAEIILNKHPKAYADLRSGKTDIGDDDELYMELFSYYSQTGDMPYGTQKARDGDPYQWIQDALSDEGLIEGKSIAKKDVVEVAVEDLARILDLAGMAKQEVKAEAEEKDFDFSKDNLELCDTCDKEIDKCECDGHDHKAEQAEQAPTQATSEVELDEYSNSPDEEYFDTDTQLNKMSGGLNGPKKQTKKEYPGDNPLAVELQDRLSKMLSDM